MTRFIHKYGNSNDHFNAPLISLPEALGELHVLKTLTIKNLAILEALPKSIGWLSLLETLHIQGCDIWQELPAMRVMTRLTSLTLERCALKELPCLEPLMALRHLCLQLLPELTRLPSSMGKLTGLRELRLDGCSGITELLSIVRMLSLETLCIEGCASLH